MNALYCRYVGGHSKNRRGGTNILVTLVVLGGIDDFVAVLVEVAVRDVQELVVWLELLVVVVRDVVLVVLVVLRKQSWRWHQLRLEVHLWPCSTPSLYVGMQKTHVYMCRRTNKLCACLCV